MTRCILDIAFYMNLKKTQKHPKQQEIFDLSMKTRIRTCQRRFKQFESGNFTLEDSLRLERPSFVPLKVLKAVVEENPKQTVRELAKQFSTCQQREL